MNARPFAIALLTALCAGACDRRRGALDPIGARVESATPRIEKATGLTFKTPPKYEMRSREEIRDFLLRKF